MQDPTNAGQCFSELAISASGNSVSSGTVVFSNSNNVSFGMSGSTVTASATASQSTAPSAISAGSQLATSGTVVFANSNGVTFGMSGSSQITASVSDASYSMLYPAQSAVLTALGWAQTTLQFMPVTVPNVVFSMFAVPVNVAIATGATATMSLSFSIGVYTRNGSSLSLLHSTSMTTQGTMQDASSSLFAGQRIISTGWTSTITKGQYWIGFNARSSGSSSTTAAGQTAAVSIVGFNNFLGSATISGAFGSAVNASNQPVLGAGYYSVGTAGLPTAVGFSDIIGTVAASVRMLAFQLGSTV